MTDLFGAYRLDEPIGRGGFSEVWRATDQRDGRPVAVKVLTGGRSARDPAFLAALREEARAVAALDHPGVVHLYDQGLSAAERPPRGSPCLVMEYADLGTLEGWRPAGWPELRSLLSDLLDALGHAHARDVLHLDLKPANILRCGPDHARPGPKLADFGATTRLMGAEDSQLLGTPRYMSPEQIGGRPQVFGPWTDLYALGAMAFELCTGEHAVPGGSLYQLIYAHEEGRRRPFLPRFDVPAGLEAWIARLMAADWRERPARAVEARRELAGIGGAVLGEPPPQFPASRSPSGRGLVGLRPTPLVARRAERERLRRWLVDAGLQRQAACVVLEGVAGTGKTRLARWVAEEADEGGHALSLLVRHGAGDRGGLASTLRAALGLELGADPAEVLRERLELDGDDLDAALGALGLGPARFERPEERWAALTRVLAGWARGRPPLLVLDDAANSVDALGLARWLLALGDRAPVRVRLVITAQTEALADRPDAQALLEAVVVEGSTERMLIGPLPAGDRLPFLEALLPLEGEAAARVLERSAGNPLHAEQLVATWLEDGTLVPGRMGFRLTGPLRAAISDHTALGQARFARAAEGLSVEQRRALELAAVLGDPCDGVEWSMLCGELGLAADAGLEGLARAGLVRGGRRRFSFTHGSVRQAVLAGAEAAGRLVDLHDAVAASLRAARDVDRARLGRHLLGAGRAAEAASLLLEAASDAEEVSDHRASAVLLDEQERAADAAGLPAAHPSRALACALRAAAVRGQARFDEAAELAAKARALATACGDAAAMARAHLETGRCCINVGEHRQAAESLQQARALAALVGDAECGARATRMLVIAHKQLGELQEADDLLADALGRWERLQRPIRAGWCALGRAQVAKQRGDLPAVERWLHEARARFLLGGGRAGIASVDNGLGELYRLQGRLAEAEGCYRAALEWSRSVASSDEVIAEANLGLLLLESGAGREAVALLAAAERTFLWQRRRELAAIMGLALAACAARGGTLAGWHTAWRPAAQAVEATSFTYYEVARVAEIAAEQAEARGWRAEAVDALELAHQQWTALGRVNDRDRVAVRLTAIKP